MRAGFGISDITPRCGVELAGFGPWLHRRAEGVREALEVRAVAVEDFRGSRAVIVGCDIISLPRGIVEAAAALIREEYPEIPAAAIMISATHTHSGPAVRDFRGWGQADSVYIRTLPHRIARAALEALRSMTGVRFAVTRVPCTGIGINRMHESRTPAPEEVLKPGWQPEHPEFTDTEVTVAGFFDAQNGILKGFLANFGCHPVSCCAENHQIHGDYPGVAIHQLMAEYPGSTGIFLQGAHGDVNTGCVHSTPEIAERALNCFAARLASGIRHALETMQIQEDEVEVSSVCLPMSCAVDPGFTLDFLRSTLAEQQKKFSGCSDDANEELRLAAVYCDGAEDLLQRYGKSGIPEQVEAKLCGIRIADLLLLGAPFEMMQGIRREVCSAADVAFPAVVSLCGDALGYAPDRESAERAKLYESKLVPLINGLLPCGNIWNELPDALKKLASLLK